MNLHFLDESYLAMISTALGTFQVTICLLVAKYTVDARRNRIISAEYGGLPFLQNMGVTLLVYKIVSH